MIVLAYSVNDPAGKGIADYLRETCSFEEVHVNGALESWFLKDINSVLAGFSDDVIYFDFLDAVFKDVDYYVILSRHSATSKIKSLTTHHTGNATGKASAGGRPFELSISNPPLTWLFLTNLKSEAESRGLNDFEVTYEVTHHGPTMVSRPLTFIEIGSSPDEWRLSKAHQVVGEVVMKSIKDFINSRGTECLPTVGFGGPHYADKFSDRAFRFGECYGHIISRYALKELRDNPRVLETIVRDAITKSSVKTERLVALRKIGSLPRRIVTSVAEELDVELVII